MCSCWQGNKAKQYPKQNESHALTFLYCSTQQADRSQVAEREPIAERAQDAFEVPAAFGAQVADEVPAADEAQVDEESVQRSRGDNAAGFRVSAAARFADRQADQQAGVSQHLFYCVF